MKSLFEEMRAGQAHLDHFHLSTPFGDGSNSGQFLDFPGVLKMMAVRAKGRQQPRTQGRARAWETVKQVMVWVLSKKIFNLTVKLLDAFHDDAELSYFAMHQDCDGLK